MNRHLIIALSALSLLLSGCASSIRSEVTAFHEWPADLQNKTYVIEAPPVQEDTLELRNYQNLVRGELAKLGFQDVGASGNPGLKVELRFVTTDIPVRVVTVTEPFFMPMYHSYYVPRRGGFHRRPHIGYRFSPFYSPYMYGMPQYEESIRHTYKRELNVVIRAVPSGKPMFDVTVHNSSRTRSTPKIMPALVRTAFNGFPGPNGVARRVDLKLAEAPPVVQAAK
jgi:hypothetical protein